MVGSKGRGGGSARIVSRLMGSALATGVLTGLALCRGLEAGVGSGESVGAGLPAGPAGVGNDTHAVTSERRTTIKKRQRRIIRHK
jgi:hypothetical protein